MIIKTKINEFEVLEATRADFPFKEYLVKDGEGQSYTLLTVFSEHDTYVKSNQLYRFEDFLSSDKSDRYSLILSELGDLNYENAILELSNRIIKSKSEYNIDNVIVTREIGTDKPICLFTHPESRSFDSIIKVSNYPSYDKNITYLFLKLLPSLLRATANFPHGDLRFDKIMLHQRVRKFSLIYPSYFIDGIFKTNPEFYPIVPPIFESTPSQYCNFPDQLAIGIMLYHILTGQHPLNGYEAYPYWLRTFNLTGTEQENTREIYPFITKSNHLINKGFNRNSYVNEIKWRLIQDQPVLIKSCFPRDFFHIPYPHSINPNIPIPLSRFCMELMQEYNPVDYYLERIFKLIKH